MSLVCAISNEIPETPVISPVSGSIFEKRLIEKALLENGNKDPVNGQALTADMLIEVKTPPFLKAKVPTTTSIPGLLKSLQDEWDAAMLTNFNLRQQLGTARQELSHAMYQHDAACRVIARLTKECVGAREALINLKPQEAQAGTERVEVLTSQVTGISPAVQQKLQDTAAVLTQERKKKSKSTPDGLTPANKIRDFKVIGNHYGLHSARIPGITALDMHGDVVVTGGNDKNVVVFNKAKEEVTATLKGHTAQVTTVACHPSERLVISGSKDCSVRVWDVANGNSLQTIKPHEDSISGLSLHATGDYILTASSDKFWAFSDIATGALLAKGGDEDVSLTLARFHPDGLIFATGTLDGSVKIWDLKEQANVANFSGHFDAITGISFSENGYYLASASKDSTVKLWDLRKLKNFKTIEPGQGFQVADLAFDQSGTYLALSGTDIRVYACKSWNELVTFAEHTDIATGVRFGDDASSLVSTSLDRTFKIYGTPPSRDE